MISIGSNLTEQKICNVTALLFEERSDDRDYMCLTLYTFPIITLFCLSVVIVCKGAIGVCDVTKCCL